MKKVFFVAALAMCMVGCCKKADKGEKQCCKDGEKHECCQHKEGNCCKDSAVVVEEVVVAEDGEAVEVVEAVVEPAQ